jgi:hypothetical protein
MARVLPRRRRERAIRRRRPEEPTALQQAIQGVNLAGGIARLAGGLGELFYPGGIPGAITDASRGEATGEELLEAQQDLMRNRMRRSIASGGIVQGPDGEQIIRPPARQMPFARDPGAEGMGGRTGFLERLDTRVQADQDRRRFVQNLRPSMPPVPSVKRPVASPDVYGVLGADKLMQTPPALAEGIAAPPRFAPKPEPSTEAPVVTTLEKFRRAAQAAKDAGNLEEFKRWSATAFTKGALNIEDLTELQKLSLERTLGAQMGEIEAAGNRPVVDAPRGFGDVYSQIVSASTPEEVDDLVAFASSIQPQRGIVAARTYGDKTREMERIEEAAWRRKLQLEKGEFPEVDLKDLADIKYKEGRADLYDPKPRSTKAGSPKQFRWGDLEQTFQASARKLVSGDNTAKIDSINEKIEKLEAKVAEERAKNPLIDQGISASEAQAALDHAKLQITSAKKAVNKARTMGRSDKPLVATFAMNSGSSRLFKDFRVEVDPNNLNASTTLSMRNIAEAQAQVDEFAPRVKSLKQSQAKIKGWEQAAKTQREKGDSLELKAAIPAEIKKLRVQLRKEYDSLRGKRVTQEQYDRLQKLTARFEQLVSEFRASGRMR